MNFKNFKNKLEYYLLENENMHFSNDINYDLDMSIHFFKKIGIIDISNDFTVNIKYLTDTNESGEIVDDIEVFVEKFAYEKAYRKIGKKIFCEYNGNAKKKILTSFGIAFREACKAGCVSEVSYLLKCHLKNQDKKLFLNKKDIIVKHKACGYKYYQNRESAIKCIDLLIKKIEFLNNELDNINDRFDCTPKYKMGSTSIQVKNHKTAAYYGKLLISREKINQLIQEFPSINFLNGLKFLLENDRKIQNKHFNEMLNLTFDENNYFANIFTNVFETQNDEIFQKEREEQLKREKELLLIKEKSKKNNLLTKIFHKPGKREKIKKIDIIAEDVVSKKDVVSKNKIFEISSQATYLYDLLNTSLNADFFVNYICELEHKNVYKILSDLKKLIEIDYIEISNKLDLSFDEKQDKLILIGSKLMLINDTLCNLKENEVEVLTENIEEKCESNVIHFAKKSAGRIYLEEDLKDVPFEYYTCAYKLLNALATGNYNGVTTKKYFNGKNKEGLFEVKADMLRLFYHNLGNNNYLVIMLSVKKADKPKVLVQKVKKRVVNTNDELNLIKDQLDALSVDPIYIDSANLICENLLSILSCDVSFNKDKMEDVLVKKKIKKIR